jgi:HAD superfamily hydrolase (TIGR01549 family)
MKVLFWIPPWASHGDPLFYRNCLRKHLIPQANLLASAGADVQFVLPEILRVESGLLNQSIRVIDLSIKDQFVVFGGLSDKSVEFYQNSETDTCRKAVLGLETRLSSSYDVIMLWETPVPFLEKMFPDALIIHQMPGAFSRPPYPHTVTFDPVGLYRRGSMYLHALDIKRTARPKEQAMVRDFVSKVRSTINSIQPFERKNLDPKQRFQQLALLPLQVSAHYAFLSDSGYESQANFLVDVLTSIGQDTGVVVTQYITPFVKDTIISPDVLAVLKSHWPNLIFDKRFDQITGISQYLIPLVDEVITSSSSIGVQALAWSRKVSVRGHTFLSPYASPVHDLGDPSFQNSNENTLSFLLGRNQPLAKEVVENKTFILNLIEEMLGRKRAGLTGLDLMPSFVEIDANYPHHVLESFNIGRAARELEQGNSPWNARHAEINKFQRRVQDTEIKIITFDIFDTLLKRPTEVPADTYKFLERRAMEVTRGAAEDFARVRLNAELETRAKSTRGEITLQEIYAAVQRHYGFEDQEIEALICEEIKLEIQIVKPRPLGQKFWRIALESGKPIHVISDMYLSIDTIQKMLTKAGYTEYDHLFLSSEHGVRKKEGLLFDVVLNELKMPGHAILHVGDNKVADIEQAEARGLKTFRLLRSVDRMRGNVLFQAIYSPKSGAGEKSRSIIAGLTAHRLFDAPSGATEKISHFQGDPYRLGYAALGPMLSGYMLWLGHQAKRDGISRLFFLSREGWLLQQIYEVLNANTKDAVPSTYLYASRRATRVASLKTRGDVMGLAGQPFESGVQVDVLMRDRFGISIDQITPSAWEVCGYTGPNEKLHSSPEGRAKFSALCLHVVDNILESAEIERAGYMAYLNKLNLCEEERPAIVDIGWQANMQGALGKLLGRSLDGYYYATLQGAEFWKSKGHRIWAYAGDMVASNHPSAAVSNRHLLEYLVCHVESSLIRVEQIGEFIRPVFREEAALGTRRLLIENVHAGAIEFSRDLCMQLGELASQVWIDPFLGERVFASFAENPHSIDVQLLLSHHFEDALGGVKKKFIVHPNGKLAMAGSIWKAGARVFHEEQNANKDSIIDVANKKNSIVFLRKVDFVSVRKFEEKIIKIFSNSKKLAKYKRDREAFFRDSRNYFLRTWYKWQL